MRPGGIFIIAATFWAATAQAGPLAFAPSAELAQPRLTLGDVADVGALPPALRAAARGLTLTETTTGARVVRYSARRLAERAAALMPALAFWLAGEPDTLVSITYVAAPPATGASGRPCLVARAAVAAGEIARADAFTPSTCVRPPADAFHYDRQTGLTRVTIDLKAGDTAPRVPNSDLAAISPGQPLYLTAEVGPVRVERAVTAIQAAAAHRALFVRADDGKIFAAPAPEDQP